MTTYEASTALSCSEPVGEPVKLSLPLSPSLSAHAHTQKERARASARARERERERYDDAGQRRQVHLKPTPNYRHDDAGQRRQVYLSPRLVPRQGSKSSRLHSLK